MRAYDVSSEEALRARDLFKDWEGVGFLGPAQYQAMEQETVSDLRRTNIFLRLVLLLFTLIIVAAAAGLFVVTGRPGTEITGIFLLFFAVLSYGAAELAVSQARLYRYGIEEALAACSVGYLCGGLQLAFVEGHDSSTTEFLVPAAGIIACLWIWHRFGLPYMPLAAMILAVWLISEWTSSHPAQHSMVAALYAAGLLAVAAIRRRHRFTCLDREYSVAEGLLWLGIYVAINLHLSSVDWLGHWWGGSRTAPEFPRPFYWTTWVLIWCLPPATLARGLRLKDRFVIAAGAICAVLTLATNKPYLGWERHSWDPMLLGGLLIGVALVTRRWLAQGPGEIRRGFTAKRLSGKDKEWMTVGTTTIGFVAPGMVTPPQVANPTPQFGGGDSGGAGATSDF